MAAIAILTGKNGKKIPAAFEDRCLWRKIRHQEGLEEGLEKGKEASIRLLLEHTKYSTARIAELVGVRVTLVRKIKKS